MTLDEAKLIKKGDHLCAEKEVSFRWYKSYRVTAPPWVSADGSMVRFFIASIANEWVSFEHFTLDPHYHKKGFAGRKAVRA